MKSYWMAIALMLCLAAAPAAAQQKPAEKDKNGNNKTVPSVGPGLSSSQVAATPEMWFYDQQMRDYMNPAMTVRHKAELRAMERHQRIAARKWFGYSNLRPTASPDPINGEYSPGWAGNNRLQPDRWSGYGQPWIVMRPGVGPY